MGLCFGCTAAATLLDETFFCPQTTPEGLCDYISQADGKDNWMDIVPGSRSIGRTGQGTREITHAQGKDWSIRYTGAGKDVDVGEFLAHWWLTEHWGEATRRNLGSALLRYPDKLARLVDGIAAGSPLPLSVTEIACVISSTLTG